MHDTHHASRRANLRIAGGGTAQLQTAFAEARSLSHVPLSTRPCDHPSLTSSRRGVSRCPASRSARRCAAGSLCCACRQEEGNQSGRANDAGMRRMRSTGGRDGDVQDVLGQPTEGLLLRAPASAARRVEDPEARPEAGQGRGGHQGSDHRREEESRADEEGISHLERQEEGRSPDRRRSRAHQGQLTPPHAARGAALSAYPAGNRSSKARTASACIEGKTWE